MFKRACCAYFMRMTSYYFYSNLLMLRGCRYRARSHSGRHRIAYPAAQWQQDDHEGKD